MERSSRGAANGVFKRRRAPIGNLRIAVKKSRYLPTTLALRVRVVTCSERQSKQLLLGHLVFRTGHLFFIQNVQAGLVWACKILTDPFHDIKLYYKAPFALMRGELIEPRKAH